MNLRGIANSVTQAVNPNTPAQIKPSAGWVTNPDGTRTPGYGTTVDIDVQRQALTQKDLMHIDGLNMAGVFAPFYIDGNWYSVNRPDGKGGDIILIPSLSEEWLVVAVTELWPDWTRVLACLQLST
ncbi:hypothetical protein [Pseudomonas knackmussii]|uniref:hypothetical protein n=1 Tax=Pseudomonas knackmussii TaxID=65741 RepID=UPI001362D52E|nr:hypothetical protein [Pseudomonas knackmussii]